MSEGMNVVHVITGLGNGGAEGALFRLVTSDTRYRHEVVSLTDKGLFGPRLEARGIPVHCLEMPRGRLTFRGVIRLYRLLRARRSAVVQTWMYHADLLGGVIGRLAGCRNIVWGIRASDAHEHSPGRMARLVVLCGAWLSRVVPRRIVYASHSGARVHTAAGYASDRVSIIPNGFDARCLHSDPSLRRTQRSHWNVQQSIAILGTVARWDPLKDHATLAAALRFLSELAYQFDWLAVWVGPGMTKDNAELVTLLQHYGLEKKVILHGPSIDIPMIMSAIDIHVLSSSSEAFPNVLAEAMACGTPCVATDVGDARHIVADTGWIVPLRDPGALSASIRTALAAMTDREEWAKRQAKCIARTASKFGLSAMVTAYHDVWQFSTDARYGAK